MTDQHLTRLKRRAAVAAFHDQTRIVMTEEEYVTAFVNRYIDFLPDDEGKMTVPSFLGLSIDKQTEPTQ